MTNGFTKIFLGWDVRPGRDQAWYDRVKSEAPVTEGMSPDLYMEQEYPSDEIEALRPTQAMAYFNGEALASLLGDCTEPMDNRKGLISIWRKPVVAAKYVAGGDLAWGEKGAYSCLVIADWQTGEQVAELHGRPDSDEMAQETFNLCVEYNRAYLGLEANGEGVTVVNKMLELGYGPHMYWRNADTARRAAGWLTDGSTRPVMLGELEEATRLRQIVPRCKDAISEMSSFIRNEKGRPEPAQGAYADHVMAWAVQWQMRKHARWPSPMRSGRPVMLPRTS
jgi:hypothetical protein